MKRVGGYLLVFLAGMAVHHHVLAPMKATPPEIPANELPPALSCLGIREGDKLTAVNGLSHQGNLLPLLVAGFTDGNVCADYLRHNLSQHVCLLTNQNLHPQENLPPALSSVVAPTKVTPPLNSTLDNDPLRSPADENLRLRSDWARSELDLHELEPPSPTEDDFNDLN